MLIAMGDDWEQHSLTLARCNYKANFFCGSSPLIWVKWEDMLINQRGREGGRSQHDVVRGYVAQLMDLGCLSAGLSVSQQCLIALLSGVWFTCTWTLSQEFLYKVQMWGWSASVNWGVGGGDRSSGKKFSFPRFCQMAHRGGWELRGGGRIFYKISWEDTGCCFVFRVTCQCTRPHMQVEK